MTRRHPYLVQLLFPLRLLHDSTKIYASLRKSGDKSRGVVSSVCFSREEYVGVAPMLATHGKGGLRGMRAHKSGLACFQGL